MLKINHVGTWSLLFWIFLIQDIGAQSVIEVSDQEGISLPGAYLLSDEMPSDWALVSDKKGQIHLHDSLFSSETLPVMISFVGMQTAELDIRKGARQKVRMKMDQVQLAEAVVTGEYAPTHAEHAVHSVEVFGKEKIEAMASSQVTDVLQHSAQIQLSRDAVIGTGISIQGLDDRNVKVTIDEVPIIGRIDGKLDLGQLDIQDIERIEIVKGPMAVSYGTDAIAGVINIITKKPEKDKVKAGARAYYSSEGQYDIHGSFSSSMKNYRMALRAGRRYFDGWSPGDKTFSDPEPIADDRRSRVWNAKEQYLAGLEHGRYAKRSTLSHSLSFMQETLKDRGLPITDHATETIFGLDDEYRSLRVDNSLKYSHKEMLGGAYKGLLSFNFFQRERSQVVTDLTDLSTRVNARDTTEYLALNSRHTWSYSFSDSLAMQLGVDGSWESSSGERIDGRPEIYQIAGFLSAEWRPFKGILVRPGIRMGYHELFSMPVIPSLALRYRVRSHTFRASYGTGFRTPSFKELYLAFFDSNHNVFGNTSLEAEESQNLNFSHSYHGNLKKGKWNTEASLFRNHIDRMISLVQIASSEPGAVAPYTYLNLDEVLTQGAHLSAGVEFSSVDLQVGATYTGREQKEEGKVIVPMDYSLQITAGAGYEIEPWNLGLNVLYTYNGPQNTVILQDELVQRLHQDGYSMLDMTLSKKLFDCLNAQIGMRNLFDVTSLTVSNGNGVHQGATGSSPLSTGRNYFLSLKYELDIKKGS